MLLIFLPQALVFFIIQLAMMVGAYLVDGYLIYMLTMPYYWQYTLARNSEIKN